MSTMQEEKIQLLERKMSTTQEEKIFQLLESRNLKKLKKELPDCNSSRELKTFLETFVKDGDVELVKLLLKRVSFSKKYLTKVCQDSLEFGKPFVAECFLNYCEDYFLYIYDHNMPKTDYSVNRQLYILYNKNGYNPSPIRFHLLCNAVTNGDLDFIEYIYNEEYTKDFPWDEILDAAIREMKRNICIFIAEKILEDTETFFHSMMEILSESYTKNVVEIIKFVYSLKEDLNLSQYFYSVEYASDLLNTASHVDNLELLCFFFQIGMDMKYASKRYRKYFSRMRKFYSRWRLIHWKNWFRRIVSPLYYSPKCQGGKKELEKLSIQKQ